jgi:Family of unknown function (DUF5999)
MCQHQCLHQPSCPAATAVDHTAAKILVARPEQGWNLLCNGVVVFDDLGELLPDGQSIAPRRPTYATKHAQLVK